ncbi:MAG TPA: hypothetical protein VLS89_08000 [Candidatus Nanopelagicales bacterium]|nr:hypothetical protein [Candidatus Nanopelagicales bacterium]
MIRVAPTPEPAEFDARVRQPGRAWLERSEGRTMASYWRRAARDLRRAFHDRCGYTAMWLSAPGTVDHFVSRDEDRGLAYEWSNLRYAAGWINSAKNTLRAEQVLDPFEVGDGWFEILLPSCQMVMTAQCPPAYRERGRTMLKRLRLGDGEDVVSYRQEWYRMYLEGELTLEGLERKAPLIARAVKRQQEQHGQTDLPAVRS